MTQRPLTIPFLADMGVLCNYMEDGRSEIELEVQQRHQNSWDMAHGGVLMTLLDVAMAIAGRSSDPDGRGVVTIEMKTSFMAPGRGKMTARGQVVHRTSTMVFCEGEIVDADGKIVSKASGTFKFIKRMPPKRESGAADSGADG
ncbi:MULTISPECIES: PaaI family thioesterase [unclassified Cupriavidus]|uniref:PaaI family thioesterase n=1 Tax=unclassified Cupriavidus TaxID=2640874 RepID=UPI001365F55B|nr:PaaI family thioesterase [Cupriavidus sp. SW-Y-13]MWL87220.1 hotdog fold thioesterase [Cupriavidus sp. SW-Y-13]